MKGETWQKLKTKSFLELNPLFFQLFFCFFYLMSVKQVQIIGSTERNQQELKTQRKINNNVDFYTGTPHLIVFYAKSMYLILERLRHISSHYFTPISATSIFNEVGCRAAKQNLSTLPVLYSLLCKSMLHLLNKFSYSGELQVPLISFNSCFLSFLREQKAFTKSQFVIQKLK